MPILQSHAKSALVCTLLAKFRYSSPRAEDASLPAIIVEAALVVRVIRAPHVVEACL